MLKLRDQTKPPFVPPYKGGQIMLPFGLSQRNEVKTERGDAVRQRGSCSPSKGEKIQRKLDRGVSLTL